MKKSSYDVLQDAIDNYYHYNPDTLMPLMMLALAMKSELHIVTGTKQPEATAGVLYPQEMINYDWVACDAPLKRRVNKWIKQGASTVAIEMDLTRSLQPIYRTFKQNDEKDVVQEHHWRLGILVNHSPNKKSEMAQRQYATFVLAETLINSPIDSLKKDYLYIYNYILVLSGLQPKRPRLSVAEALNALLKYDGKGLVYNPFTGCSIAGAMLQAKDNFYGDGSENDKEYAAGLLLNYGLGLSNEHFIKRDSKQWLSGKQIDYVISTYTGFINGESAFDFCLGKCLEDSNFKGRYAGMVFPREIFEKRTANFEEALKRDWVDTIALLPFGEAAVLINADKAINQEGKIRFIDGTIPLAKNRPIETLLEDDMFAEYIKLSDAKKKGFLQSLVVPNLPDIDGYQKVRLGDIVSRISRNVYNLDSIEDDLRVMAYIDRTDTYYGMGFLNENIERRTIGHLFNPVYNLNEDSLIVNASGPAEPRIFSVEDGPAFFEDGYAFSLISVSNDDYTWLIKELNESYVRKQLHPYGSNNMIPEPVSEDDYLNLVLYREENDYSDLDFNLDDIFGEAESDDTNDGQDALPTGYELQDGNITYTILNYIACGSFGYTYRAEMFNRTFGSKEIVAIKEFYPRLYDISCIRENNRVMYNPEFEKKFIEYKTLFQSEPDFILSMADMPDNHVTEVKSIFECEETGTMYYVMKYYSGESLNDMVISNQVPSSEKLIVEKIAVPLCKALHAMQSHYILHLDIKPDNVVIDENGEAILIDFGVAQQYDSDGKLVSIRGIHSNDAFTAPENHDGNMRYFCPQSDIYSVAATLYYLVTGGQVPEYIMNQNNIPTILDPAPMNCSEKMKKAIIEGLSYYTNDRPANAQHFLNLFPGCENIKLG